MPFLFTLANHLSSFCLDIVMQVAIALTEPWRKDKDNHHLAVKHSDNLWQAGKWLARVFSICEHFLDLKGWEWRHSQKVWGCPQSSASQLLTCEAVIKEWDCDWPCVCFGFLIQILFFFQIDKSDNTTFFVAGMLTQLKIYLGHFVVNVTKILTFKYFGSNVLVRTSCKWCQPVLLEF